MARTARDCRLLFETLTGDVRSPAVSATAARPLAGLRIAHLAHIYRDILPASESIQDAIDVACRTLEELGATIVSARVRDFLRFCNSASAILHAEAYRYHCSRLLGTPGTYGRRCYHKLMEGAAIESSDYARAIAARPALVAELNAILSDCDLIVTAVVADPACRFEDEEELECSGRSAFRIVFNLSGHPALALCAGFSPDGLPLGMQMVGRMGEDETLLAVAEAFQQATDWHLRHPGVFETGGSSV
jgi:aspartyl-tRNA(Asn)/glutamyl-tRNA(Gln) amidotransferase subunit A